MNLQDADVIFYWSQMAGGIDMLVHELQDVESGPEVAEPKQHQDAHDSEEDEGSSKKFVTERGGLQN